MKIKEVDIREREVIKHQLFCGLLRRKYIPQKKKKRTFHFEIRFFVALMSYTVSFKNVELIEWESFHLS